MQIVENRTVRLSRPFLGYGDIFPKSNDENQIRSERTGGTHAPRGRVQILSMVQYGYGSVGSDTQHNNAYIYISTVPDLSTG